MECIAVPFSSALDRSLTEQVAKFSAPSFKVNWLRTSIMLGAIRFVWNATRGHRFSPWRSEFLRWRVETYSGKPAETLRAREIFGFFWESKWELLDFLKWTGEVQKEAQRRS